MFDLSTSEKIDYIAKRKGVSKEKIAKKLGMTRQNLHVKFKNNSLKESELKIICEMLDLDFKIEIFEKDSDTN